MMTAPLPPNEAARLLALNELDLLDTPSDPVLDGLVRCAATVLRCPIALVSLVDEHRQWFLSRTGMKQASTPRELAFCAHAILGEDLFVVCDAARDERFVDHPHVTGEPHVRFYAGAPLVLDGQQLGTLCVIDHEPREFDAPGRALLADLARAVMHWLVSWREHRQLRDTQGFLARIARHVPGAFYQYRLAPDGSSHFPYASEGLNAVYELAPESVRRDASAVFTRLHPDDLMAVRAAIADSALTLQPWSQQYRVCLPQRGERWLEGQATPQRVDDGSVLWCGFIHDITERRAAEHVLRENFASERASQAKSEFLSRMSHELRTPLNAVLGFTQLMLADRRLPERTHGHLEQVRRAGQHLLELVNDVLDLTRIERGFLALRSEAVDVNEVLRASLALVEPLAGQRGVRIMPPEDDAPVLVQGDARALGQVLLNLLSNGVKYNREQGRLWVELLDGADEVLIRVGDEGSGLSAEQKNQLFQPFQRLGAEHGPVPGSGLGLAIARQLVEAMQGRLLLLDRPGEGCVFELTLPAARPVPPGPQRRLNVLCAEDNPANAQLLQELLEQLGGCRVRMASDGEQALQMARQETPDLLLSDIHMPHRDGLALVRAFRADMALAPVRCIALSGDASKATAVQARAAGFDAVWPKPLDLELLRSEIDALLARSRHAPGDN
jgi:signal transduction histidine kinase/ActR/RegA family two-component response regulator